MTAQKQNYQLILDKTIQQIKEREAHPSLLLHVCCAPCSSYVLEYLANIFDITLFFYNPNISPRSEHDFRYTELCRLVEEMGLCDKIKIKMSEYESQKFFDMAKGLEHLPEGGERCRRCYSLRLEKSAEYARDAGFDFFTTTLSISPHKDAAALNEIGMSLAEKYGVPYLVSDFKKKNGYKRSCELSAVYSLYRQDYCGCVYSKENKK